MSLNGELLFELMTKKLLILINTTDKSSDMIKRMRVKGNKVEKVLLIISMHAKSGIPITTVSA